MVWPWARPVEGFIQLLYFFCSPVHRARVWVVSKAMGNILAPSRMCIREVGFSVHSCSEVWAGDLCVGFANGRHRYGLLQLPNRDISEQYAWV